MSRTKIDWQNPAEGWKLDETHNIITGCLHNCGYCFAKRFARRFPARYGGASFPPMFHGDRLGYFERKKKPTTFFLTDMGDMWGWWVPDKWIKAVLADCHTAPQHRYMFLTKNPARYADFYYLLCGLNAWAGLTLTGAERPTEKEYKCSFMAKLKDGGIRTFLSAEPLLGELHMTGFEKGFDLVIVGAMSGPGAVPVKREWVDSIKHPNIFYKKSARGIL